MAERAVLSVEVDVELRDQFMAEAEAADQPAAQVLGQLMREFIERRRQARDHDAWFRAEVEQGLREADDPNVARIPHEEVMAGLERMLEEFAKTAGAKAG